MPPGSSESMLYVPVLPPERIAASSPSALSRSRVSTARHHHLARRRLPLREADDVRGTAGIRLDAPDPQRLAAVDPLGQLHGGRAGRDARPVVADVEIHQDIHPDPLRQGGLRQQVGLMRVADGQHDRRILPDQRDHPGDLPGLDDRRGQEHPRDAGGDHRLGLRDGRHRDPPRPRGQLPPRDLRALVRLGVRPQRTTVAATVLRHLLEIGLEPVQVHQQRRRRQVGLVRRPGDLGGGAALGAARRRENRRSQPGRAGGTEAATIPDVHGGDSRSSSHLIEERSQKHRRPPPDPAGCSEAIPHRGRRPSPF